MPLVLELELMKSSTLVNDADYLILLGNVLLPLFQFLKKKIKDSQFYNNCVHNCLSSKILLDWIAEHVGVFHDLHIFQTIMLIKKDELY